MALAKGLCLAQGSGFFERLYLGLDGVRVCLKIKKSLVTPGITKLLGPLTSPKQTQKSPSKLKIKTMGPSSQKGLRAPG